jgi:hypothetical protein
MSYAKIVILIFMGFVILMTLGLMHGFMSIMCNLNGLNYEPMIGIFGSCIQQTPHHCSAIGNYSTCETAREIVCNKNFRDPWFCT